MEHQVRRISEYVETQARDEKVEHAERMISTKVAGVEHEVWDVRTDTDRYWVVTNPTNLYSQDEFKSADYSLTFHIGIGIRLMERSRVEVDEDVEEQVDVAWRKYRQAVDAFNDADEAEAFQAVGVRCREAHIALARRIAGQIPEAEMPDRPKASDFKGWAEAGAERFAEQRRLRAYLKTISEKSWDMTVWLQHFEEATPWDAELVLDATSHLLSMYGLAMHRHEQGPLNRCPRCGSYRVEWDGGLTDENPDIQWQQRVCGACEHQWNYEFIRLDPEHGWVATDPPGSGGS